ncbi:MAG: glycosyltransferase family 4 protein [Candidatus Acidiferrales bacterium]
MTDATPQSKSKAGRLKLLVSAYACEPDKGSEPGVGWTWVRQIATREECWVITRANNRAVIENRLSAHPMPNAHFVYYDLPAWARFWKKGSRGVRAYYYLWQIGAYRVARKLHRAIDFDLAHHVTFGSYWLPSFLALLPVPFIWGPVGGGESAPKTFRKSFSFRGRIFEFLRDASRFVRERDPFVRMTARRAAACLATTPETALRLRALGARDVALAMQFAWSPEEINESAPLLPRKTGCFRVISLGRFLHWKGFGLGIEAFAKFHREFPSSEYWLVGDGPERKRWAKLARRLGVEDSVIFCGSVSRSAAMSKMAESDVLLHPALHDASPMVVAEAMRARIPVVCLDIGGPGIEVTEGSGIKVPAISPEQAVDGIALAMKRLAEDPARSAEIGNAARERMKEAFSWERKGIFLATLYDRITAGSDGGKRSCHTAAALTA